MLRGGRTDVASQVLGVWITSDATENGDPCAFGIEAVTTPRVQGKTRRARDASPHNRSFLVLPTWKMVITNGTLTLWWALVPAFEDDSARDCTVYHRVATFDGKGKPDRNAGGLTAPKWDYNFPGDQIQEITAAIAPTEGAWEEPD
jgi:hypothetical protein